MVNLFFSTGNPFRAPKTSDDKHLEFVKTELKTETWQTYRSAALMKDVIWSTDKWTLILSGILFIATNFLSILSVDLMKNVITLLTKLSTDKSTENYHLFLAYLSGSLVCQITMALCNLHGSYLLDRLGLTCRYRLSRQLVECKLRSKRSSTNYAAYNNALTTDMSAIENLFGAFHYSWSSPLQLFLILHSLFKYIGRYAFASVALFLVYIIVQVSGTSLSKYCRKRYLKANDERLDFFSETLRCIKIVKTMALEPIFLKELTSLREKEVSWLRKDLITRCSFIEINGLLTTLTISLTCLVLVLNKAANLATILAVISLYKKSQNHMNMIPISISAINDGLVSLSRIEPLLTVETEESGWSVSQSDEYYELSYQQNKMRVHKGDLVRVKTGISPEMLLEIGYAFAGSCEVGYCGPEPWLLPISIRENILFGLAFEKKRYQKCLEACLLLPDISSMPSTDSTIVSEDMSNLSGGQRVRIALARVLYGQAPVWILTNVLKSLDTQTAEQISASFFRMRPSHVTVFVSDDAFMPNAELELCSGKIHLKFLPSSQSPKHVAVHLAPALERIVLRDISIKSMTPASSGTSWTTILLWVRNAGGLKFLISILALKVSFHLCRLENDKKLAQLDFTAGEFVQFILATFCQLTFPFICSLIIYLCGLRSSSKIHLTTVKAAVTSSFLSHTGPSKSKLISLLGKDQEYADISLPIYVNAFAAFIMSLVFTLIGIISKNLYMTIPLGIVVLIFATIIPKYLSMNKLLKALEISHRSDISRMNRFMYAGVDYIRLGRNEQYFTEEALLEYLKLSAVRLQMASLDSCVSLIVKIASHIGTFSIGICSISMNADHSLAALCLNYSTSLPSLFLWTFRQFAKLEIHLLSISRIAEATKVYSPEPVGGVNEIGSQVESIRALEIYSCYQSMSEKRQHSFCASKGCKLAIVGRTGAGKSSMMLQILGIISLNQGSIIINGVPLEDLNVKKLRMSTGYIAQESLIVKNRSVRFNIDPDGNLPDSELWKLLKIFSNNPLALDGLVTESMSEKQLQSLSFVRALARNSSALLLDEPLASYDKEEIGAILSNGHLQSLLQEKVMLVITHQEGWINGCDSIVCI